MLTAHNLIEFICDADKLTKGEWLRRDDFFIVLSDNGDQRISNFQGGKF